MKFSEQVKKDIQSFEQKNLAIGGLEDMEAFLKELNTEIYLLDTDMKKINSSLNDLKELFRDANERKKYDEEIKTFSDMIHKLKTIQSAVDGIKSQEVKFVSLINKW